MHRGVLRRSKMNKNNFDYDALRADAIAKGQARWMYEKVDEPLPSESIWKTVPDYYTAHVEQKNARVRELMRGCRRMESFAFFTDAHVRQSAMTSVPILRSILENTDVQDVIYGGDTVSAWTDETDILLDTDYFARAYAFAKPYVVRGNHDMYGKRYHYTDRGVVKTPSEVYDSIMRDCKERVNGEAGKNYYYFDHAETQTRYIVIDTNEIISPVFIENGIWECEVDITETQLRWLIDLLSKTPLDWGVIVCSHIPITTHLKWSHPRALTFGDLIEAYNRRTEFDCGSLHADFTAARGRVLLCVCGHGHIDDLYVSPTGCIYVETHCDSAKNNNGGSPYPREMGTITESVIDVMILDRDTNKLHIVRYGAGEDREA